MSTSHVKTAASSKATRPQPQKRAPQPQVQPAARGEPARRVQVAVVGCGYWGPNLIRNFASAPTTEMAVICDRDPQRLARVAGLCPQAERVEDFREVLADPNVDAIAIATPVGTHFSLATAALEAGKHVLIEKPLAASTREAEQLVALADKL